MPEVDQLLPERAPVDADALVRQLRQAQRELRPFHPEVVAFAGELARRLRRLPTVRDHPALGALAFWIRPTSVERLRAEWDAGARPGRARVPRGVAFHIPPTNVDTLFVYSWLLSALVGNANVVRLSRAAADAGGPLLEVLADVVAAHPLVARTTAVVTYGHEEPVTAALSRADVRVIWGGDDTVAAVRAVPLAPHATELAFPDRFSLVLLDAPAVAALDDGALGELAGRFYNDAYWFDQMGCASPRAVVWRGGERDATAAQQRWFDALAAVVEAKGYDVATGAVLAKLTHASDVASHGALAGLDWRRNPVTVGTVRRLGELPRDSPGGGLFYTARVERLEELAEVVQRRDQTLTTYGFDEAELTALAVALNGRGIDRIVPVGEALSFDHLWDGVDLLAAFSRLVVVKVAP